MKPTRPILLWIIPCALLAAGPAHATFTDITAGMTGVMGAAAWGDYDGDGDLDLALAGSTIAGKSARIYRNTAGVFADASALPAGDAILDKGAVAWGDYDRDGDLDLAIAGDTGAGLITRVVRNNAGTFSDLAQVFAGVTRGDVSWVDSDNDGDLDLVVVGLNGSGAMVANLHRNDGGLFGSVVPAIVGLKDCSMAWADHDNDGDMDLALAGDSSSVEFDQKPITRIYRNTSGVFQLVAAGLPGVNTGSLNWGDFDNDGDPDLLISGEGANSGFPVTSIYTNTAGTFSDAGAGLQTVAGGAARFGDYDSDGDLDVALCGYTLSDAHAEVYRNDSGSFVNIGAGLIGMYWSTLAWADYDNDADLDLTLVGQSEAAIIARVYRNDGVPANSPPAAPTGLSLTADATTVTFQWNAATDAQNTPAGLSYNLWAGTAPGTANIMAPMSDLETGYRRVVQLGNVGQKRTWSLPRSKFGANPIHWGVQAVDQSFAGSAFATGPSGVLAVDDLRGLPGLTLRLRGANPFRSEARFLYTLPRAAHVDLAVHDLTGRRICTLVEGDQPSGEHEARWTGEAVNRARIAPGVYLVRLRAGGAATSIKILEIE